MSNIEVEEGNPVYDSREGCNAIIETASNTLVLGCKNTTFPTSVVGIGIDAFHDCTGLTSLSIGNGIQKIGENAFASTEELTDVYCFAENVPYDGWCAYKDSPIEYATLHVPENSLGQYKTTYPWSDFGNIVALTEEEITNIKDITTQSVRERYFDLSGKKLEAPIEGITIVVTEFEDGRQMVKRLVK